MKHLFIINPVADKVRGRVHAVAEEIKTFFESNSSMEYDIHVTRWARDAEGFVRNYTANAEEIIRVHVFGGSGTLFEVVNGVIGTPNVQVAAYPMGGCNDLLRYFGNDKLYLFSSIKNQVFSGVTPIDAIKCGTKFCVAQGLIGLEARSDRDGFEMYQRTNMPFDLCIMFCVLKNMFSKNRGLKCKVKIDEQEFEGRFVSMMCANTPCYSTNWNPAVDAHPNNGSIEVYMIKDSPLLRLISNMSKYLSGNYRKIPSIVSHYRGSKITISSEDAICVCIDGELFFANTAEYEIIPYAIDLVCPNGIDILKMPLVYGKPEEGLVCDRQ